MKPIISTDDYVITDGDLGRRLTLKSRWNSKILDLLTLEQIKELELNRALGWKDKNLSFLSELTFLEGLVFNDWLIDDIGPIHQLPALRLLQVSSPDTTEIDFTQFPHLEKCGLAWRARAKSIFQCSTLKWLFLTRYPGKNLNDFARLKDLNFFTLSVSPLDTLSGLEALSNLKVLGLHYLSKLTSLRGIEKVSALEELEITHCKKIVAVDDVKYLQHLKKLNLSNNAVIESLKVVGELHELRELYFFDSTNIQDGDLSFILGLKKLNKLAFQNREHYSHKSSDFTIGD